MLARACAKHQVFPHIAANPVIDPRVANLAVVRVRVRLAAGRRLTAL